MPADISMTIDGNFLLGLSALLTTVTTSVILLLGQHRNKAKVEEVHKIVNSQQTHLIEHSERQSDRNDMLQSKLDQAGIHYPPDHPHKEE